jgi:hypothetical protein
LGGGRRAAGGVVGVAAGGVGVAAAAELELHGVVDAEGRQAVERGRRQEHLVAGLSRCGLAAEDAG